jgi:hypothetical protein
MIKELSDALRSFIISLSRRPVETLLALLLLVAAYIGYRSYDALEKMIITPEEEAARFERQLHSADLVNEALENLRVELGADNVLIKQFHNGRHDLTGIPFTEATTTFIADPLMEGTSHAESREEPIPSMNRSLRMVWKEIDRPQCTVLYDPIDISTKRYFYNHGLNRAVVCPLVNLLNYPIGIIVVGFSEGNTVEDQVAITKTSQIGKRVAGYLNDY